MLALAKFIQAFADDQSNVTQNTKFFFHRGEIIVGKGENARYQHCLLSHNVFKTYSSGVKLQRVKWRRSHYEKYLHYTQSFHFHESLSGNLLRYTDKDLIIFFQCLHCFFFYIICSLYMYINLFPFAALYIFPCVFIVVRIFCCTVNEIVICTFQSPFCLYCSLAPTK